jgi:16S rRNA A1518/A1519 N6-dimethyltransferase RsmA/KsgA/DIM1 with predicted DNA glycosylase/AP lyase activity
LDLRRDWLGGINPEEVLKLVKIGFSARRKQLFGNLVRGKICSAEKAKETLKKNGLDEKARAENLTPAQWVELYNQLFS